eukprot:g18027.t1
MTVASDSAEVPVKPDEVAIAVWTEIKKLRDEIPAPPADGLYPNADAADAFQRADQAVASLCAVPREEMLEGFTQLVEGSRLDELLDALVSSEGHPALQHSCLMVMCGVASLKKAHDEVTKRKDVLKALLAALGAPKAQRISPEGAEEDLQINAAVGAAICLNSLLVSCGGLGEDTIKVWQELDALSAITSALEAHSVFEGGGDEDVLPAMLFGLATPLLTHSQQQQRARQQQLQQQKQQQQQQQQQAANATQPPPAERTEAATTTPSKKEDAGAAAATATVDEEAGKASRAARQRLAEAFLRLLAERREWVARSLAMAANASPTDLSGGQAAPAPVTINNLLVNSLAHADLLGAFTRQTPVRLRAQAVAAARKCEADGTFAPGFAPQLTRLLGLGGQQDLTRRMAGHTVQKINKKEAARAANIKCSRPKCGKRQGNASGGCKFKVCSRCQVAMYCSGECQVAHWKEGHKMECKKKP